MPQAARSVRRPLSAAFLAVLATACPGPEPRPPSGTPDDGGTTSVPDSGPVDLCETRGDAPTVRFTEPPPGMTVKTSVALKVEAGGDCAIASVEFSVGTHAIAAVAQPPWETNWEPTGLANGNYEVTAKATDSKGRFATATVDLFVEPTCAENADCAPVLRVNNPAPGSTVCGTITIGAAATDDHDVPVVQFKADETLLGTVVRSPYLQDWDTTTVPDGAHILKAIASDSASLTETHTIRVTVDNSRPCPPHKPTVAFTCPAADPRGQALCVTGTVHLCAVARADGLLDWVRYSVDSNPVGGTPQPPNWEADWNTATPWTEGAQTLKATARDTSSPPLTGEAVLQVNVNRTKPTVRFTAPEEGFVSAGEPVDLAVAASAANSCGIAGVAVEVSGPANATLTTDPETHTARFDPAGLPSGHYTLAATATDRAGNTQAAQRSILVDRPPTITLVSPTEGQTLSGTVTVQADAHDDLSSPTLSLVVDGQTDGGAYFDSQGRTSWNTVGAAYGTHAVSVCARDSRQQVVCTNAANVTVDQPLRVRCKVITCTSGTGGCTCDDDGCWTGGVREAFGTVTVRAEVSDDEPVDHVEFRVDGELRASDTTSPYEGTWDTTVDASGQPVADASVPVACKARNTRGVEREDEVSGLGVNNCNRDHDGYLKPGGLCGGTDCNDASTSVGACVAPTSTCQAGACVCSGTGATDTCILADAGYCRGNGTCGDCANDGQCGTGYTCLNTRCVRTCADDAACGTGYYCRADAPRICTACSETEAAHCGTTASPAGCAVCSGATPTCSDGACVCTSDSSCGAGKYCSGGACVSCSVTDATRCGTTSAPAGCNVCSGAMGACSAGVCTCGGGGATDTCVLANAGVCSGGACTGCTSSTPCGAGRYCGPAGRCVSCGATDAAHCGSAATAAGCVQCSAPLNACFGGACVCGSDASCGDGKFCSSGGACEACSQTDRLECGTTSSPAGCLRCDGICSGGACAPCTADAQCGTNGHCTSGACQSAGGEMVRVPAGAFWMGCNSAVDSGCYSDESPYHQVTLSSFDLDTTEVTQAAYKACLDAGACTSPNTASSCKWDPANRAQRPVVCVDWNQATAYCAWAGKRLPTEAEWEKAARGSDGRVYPWGNQTATCQYAVMSENGDGCGTNDSWDVASKPAGDSPYAAHDMAGNVWEWVGDWYDGNYYAASPSADPQGPMQGIYRVYRGGCWRVVARDVRASSRNRNYPGSRDGRPGFPLRARGLLA